MEAKNRIAQAHLFFASARLEVSWRAQTGRRKSGREGGSSRSVFVPYVDVDEVKRVLRKAVIAGVIDDWTAKYDVLERIDQRVPAPDGGESTEPRYVVRCTLSVRIGEHLLHREDVGDGRDYKAAYSDALKRAAQHYGIGAVLEGLRAVSVEVDNYGNPLPKEEERLSRLVEAAYRQLWEDLFAGKELPASPETNSPTPSVTASPSSLTPGPRVAGDLEVPPPPHKASLPPEGEAAPSPALPPEVQALLRDMAKADATIGEMVDRFAQMERRVAAVKILSKYGWKRGLFSENPPLHEVQRFLSAFLKRPVSAKPEDLRQALEQAKAEARKLYQELRHALQEEAVPATGGKQAN